MQQRNRNRNFATLPIQTVRSPRCHNPSLYADQLVTRCFCFGILSRRAALNLYGIYSILNKTECCDISAGPIRASTPLCSRLETMRTKTPYFLPSSFTQTTALVERLIAENIQSFLKPSEPNRSLEAVDCLNSTQEPLRAVSEAC